MAKQRARRSKRWNAECRGAKPARMSAWAEDFCFGVLAGVNSGGDADMVGAMAGALLGAKFGAAEIEKTSFLTGLDKLGEILETADKLFAASAKTSV